MKLPIDALMPAIMAAAGSVPNLIIEAAPGAGKTTRVPPALMQLGDVLVLEPRRLAARMAATRVASELGEKAGGVVGYQVRFEDVSSSRTRIKFLTEGVLTRRLLSDPQLRGIRTVVLDEFHERHLESDLALALLRRLQKTTRPDLRLVVMSATLDTGPIAKYLDDCPVFRSEVRSHPLEIEYTPHSAAPLEAQVSAAVEKLLGKGDVLVFLPGAAEIRRAARALEPLAKRAGLLVVPLHGDLSAAEQDRAVSPADRPKVILSTNVAESSVTIEGVRAVVDSGLVRVAADSPWTGLPSVEVKRISQASAKQRAGRAGRLGPGRAIRLYTEQEYHRRPAADVPEILRRELSQMVLQLRAMEIQHLDFLDPPPVAALDAAGTLLDKLAVTPEMAGLPLPPRLAKLVTEAKRRGVPEKGCAAAAVLSAGERGSDLLALTEANWQPQTQRVFDQLRRQVGGRDARGTGDSALLQSVLAAFPDRVARHRRDGELLLSGGGSAKMPGCHWDFLIAIDIEERREHGLPLVRLAAPIEPEWLLDRATERVRFEWNRAAERVEQVSALLYDELVIEETRAPAAPGEEAGRLLAQKALEAGIGRFVDGGALEQMKSRAALGGVVIDAEGALRELCNTVTSFAEIEAADLLEMLRPARLEHAAPAQIKLSGGRAVKVHYEAGKPPWIESRLQDFFGMHETPRISGAPVVVHLLAPNQRPVQVTSDLKGFWERLYPQVRKELMRRYPRHKWPENPG
ncbi:MAG: ATP-dependent helicase HrpB [Acidobacteriota bacterium]